MAITRANVEVILIRRCGGLLTAAGLDGTTVTGTNVDLNDPIGYGIRFVGGAVTAITLVADADLSGISADDYDALLDAAEVRALESVLGNLDDVNIKVGQLEEDRSDLAERVQKTLERKRTQLERTYGLGVSTLEAGMMTLDFATKGDDEVA
jgi:hypothetical protein